MRRGFKFTSFSSSFLALHLHIRQKAFIVYLVNMQRHSGGPIPTAKPATHLFGNLTFVICADMFHDNWAEILESIITVRLMNQCWGSHSQEHGGRHRTRGASTIHEREIILVPSLSQAIHSSDLEKIARGAYAIYKQRRRIVTADWIGLCISEGMLVPIQQGWTKVQLLLNSVSQEVPILAARERSVVRPQDVSRLKTFEDAIRAFEWEETAARFRMKDLYAFIGSYETMTVSPPYRAHS